MQEIFKKAPIFFLKRCSVGELSQIFLICDQSVTHLMIGLCVERR